MTDWEINGSLERTISFNLLSQLIQNRNRVNDDKNYGTYFRTQL